MREWAVGRAVLSAITAFGALGGGMMSVAAAQESGVQKYVHCDFEYVIQSGDTLASISETAYGAQHQQLIFARNWNRIDMLGELPAGKTIIVPCASGDAEYTPNEEELEDAMLASDWVSAPPVSADEANSVASALDDDTLRLLTADGQAPYVDSMMRNGGFFAELVGRALNASPLDQRTETVFVNDRSTHLTDLLAEGSFDVGFPWLRPPCEEGASLAALSGEAAQLCQSFVFSEPVFEGVSGFFVRTQEAANLNGYEAFIGSRICAPEGDDLVALGVKGITKETTKVLRSATPAGCIGMLIVGEVDAVVADSNEGARAIAAFGASNTISERTDLSTLKTLHAIAPADKPDAVAALEDLNEGLRAIRADGRWFQIVGRFLAVE